MTTCGHAPTVARACRHLLEREQFYRVRFTGRGIEHELICAACSRGREMIDVCAACRDRATGSSWIGIVGEPEVAEAPRPVRFEHESTTGAHFVDIQPIIDGDRAVWLAVSDDGVLHRWEPTHGTSRALAQIPDGAVSLAQPLTVKLSRDHKLAVVANRRGGEHETDRAVVLDLEAGAATFVLQRPDYHADRCNYSLAFVERGIRQLLVHASAWNRLDVVDVRTGELLTPRGPTSERGDDRVPHYLDYFHCELAVSPDQRYMADAGWVWHPTGVVHVWSVDRWLAQNVWESEDGPSKRAVCSRVHYWDGPMTWIDDTRLAVWGYGEDYQWLIPAARIFDVTTGDERWFPGPRGQFAHDRVLASFGDTGLALWDVDRGARIAQDPVVVTRYHPGAKVFANIAGGELTTVRPCGLDAEWATPRVRDVAYSIARERSFDELPVLGDALQLAGCTDAEILAHCAHPGEHDDRCWVIDRLLVE